ncbi:MAG: sodium:proton antiporter [Rickettsiales bacterium]|nr:sodium:proton antiporter [Rickettsiales bacterium]
MLLSVSALLLLCLVCLFVSWRYTFPAIVMYAIAGILLGEVFGVLDPQETLGTYYFGLIALCVAIILFEGGLHLSFKGLRESKGGTLRMLLVSTPINFVLNVLAAYYVADFSLGLSCVIAGLFTITGPTVVMPLLQQNKVKPKVGSMLKWEAIVNDPVGALLAVFAYEFLVYSSADTTAGAVFTSLNFLVIVAGIAAISVGAAYVLKIAFTRGFVPEYLKQPVILTMVIFLFAISDEIQKEGGLIAVTAFGIALANSKFASYHDTKRFKEYIAILLVGVIFILISSTLKFEMMTSLGYGTIGFVALAIFVTRPLSVYLATIGSNMSLQERIFIGWIAPRGIVCAVTAGLVAPKLMEAGYAGAEAILPVTFLMIFATVTLHGFSMGWLAKRFGLAQHEHGVLIVGSNAFSVELAKVFQRQKMPVLIADTNWHQLKQPRMADIPVHYGEILSEEAYYELDLEQYSYLVLATSNVAYNSLVGANYIHLFGRHRVFHIDVELDKDGAPTNQFDHSLKGPVIGSGHVLTELIGKAMRGWRAKAINLTDEYSLEQHDEEEGSQIPLFLINTKNGAMRQIDQRAKGKDNTDFTLISLVHEDEAAQAKAKVGKASDKADKA